MIDQTLRDAKTHMQLVLDALTDQLKSLQVGRANASMVDQLMVEQYGSMVPLKQTAQIAVPEANQILITPWDKSALAAIEKAVRESDLGVNPVNDGKAVRIMLPQMTEERRRDLLKVVGKMAEEARIAMRNGRHTAWESVQKAQKEGAITEDDRDRARAELDKLIDNMNTTVELTVKNKEQEMLAI